MTEPTDSPTAETDGPETAGLSWRVRLAIVGLILFAIGVVLFTNQWLTQRFTETTRSRAELRLALYSGNILTELQRNSVVPLLLARDPELIGALTSGSFAFTSQRLISFQSEIGAASILLLDSGGRVVAATTRQRIGTNYSGEPFFVEAQRAGETVFSAAERAEGGFGFSYSRALVSENRTVGVIVVEVDLAKYERAWAGLQDAVVVTDSQGMVMLATEPRWRGLPLEDAIALIDAPNPLDRKSVV